MQCTPLLFNIALSILLYFYEADTLITAVISLFISTSSLLAYAVINHCNYSKIYIKYIEIASIVGLTVQLIHYCNIIPTVDGMIYLVIKQQEHRIRSNFNNYHKWLISILYNGLIIILLAIDNSHPASYYFLTYGVLILLNTNTTTNELPQTEVQLYEQLPPQSVMRDRQVFSQIEESLTKLWRVRLQNIPVGILIIDKVNMIPTFYNQQLSSIFSSDIPNIVEYVLNSLLFQININKKAKIIRETSLNVRYSHCGQQLKQSQHKIKIDRPAPQATLMTLLTDMINGRLKHLMVNGNYLELSTCTVNNKTKPIIGEHMETNILCKIFSGPEDKEILIIIDDITMQAYLQKLEIKDKFKVKIIESFSHELRTPLNSAQLFIQAILQDLTISDEIKFKYAIPASIALNLQAYLIKDIIDFTQFHSSQICYNIKEFSFEEVVQEINFIFKSLFEMKNLGLHVSVSNITNPIIFTDSDRLMQIIVNCLQNAIKFSPQGSTVVIEVEGKQGYIEFTIKDQGIGMDQERLTKIQNFLDQLSLHQDFIFQDEWQGLGLLISQILLFELSPKHKSKLKINSFGINQGTQVTFRIKSNQSCSTQIIFKKTLQGVDNNKPPQTVPAHGFGIQGLLIISNPQSQSFKSTSIKQIPNRRQTSISQFFRPPSRNLSIQLQSLRNIDSQTDLLEYDNEKSAVKNISKLHRISKKQLNFIKEIHSEGSQCSFIMKSRRFTQLQISSKSELNKINNTLISRLQQKEEQDVAIERKFNEIQSKCDCNVMLSVDDEIYNQRALQLLIGQLGFQVIIAFNGKEALEILERRARCSEQCHVFNFILMDCQMPILDGWRTTEILMEMIEQQAIPNIPVFGLTAFNGPSEIERCYSVGMKVVLGKPLKISELKQAIIDYCQ